MPNKKNKIEAILEERGQRYGDFEYQGALAQRLKFVISSFKDECCNEDEFPMGHYQAEALDMILHKISRIVAGDRDYVDSWDDIAGYATLVSKILKNETDD